MKGFQFYDRASCKLSDGTLIFGGTQGLTIFNPQNVNTNQQISLLFETLKIHNEIMLPGKNGCIKESMEESPHIHLSYKQNSFSIAFSAIDYSDYKHIHYFYQMAGFDNTWIDAGNNNEAYYSNLPAGNYTFKVKMVGNSGTDGMTRNATTFSNRVMDINPEDIADISVLKGAAAAALYGSRAADGAIIITTKKGAEGSVKIDYSGKLSASSATKLPEVQKQFGRGYYADNGVFNDQTYNSWGKAYDGSETLYDNIGNFFRTGTVLDNNVSISGGSKNQSFFLSLSNYDQQGIVRKTGYNKTTVRFNGEQKFGKLTVSANVTYSLSKTDKTLTSGGLWGSGGTGTMTALYGWPLQEDMSHYLNEDGTKYRLFDGVWELASDKENPY